MEPPAITRHRRPFLAPLWISLLAAVVLAVLAFSFYHSAAGTTLVVLVHAGAREPGLISDAPLSPEGEERAQHLAQVLGERTGALGLDQIYVTGDQRAQQTAAPLAARLQRPPKTFTADQVGATAAHLLHEHVGKAVLVVADGAAFNQMLEALGLGEFAGSVDEVAVVYLISVPSLGRARVLRLHL
jgi:phosphohistidine phosphatase SixA